MDREGPDLVTVAAMRISVDEKDPGFANFRGHATKVLLDGVEVHDCITADEEAGECLCYKDDENGKPVLDGDEIATEIRRGKVQIIHPESLAAR